MGDGGVDRRARAFVGAGVAVGGALFFADRRVSGVEGTVESLDRRVSRLERENGMTAGKS